MRREVKVQMPECHMETAKDFELVTYAKGDFDTVYQLHRNNPHAFLKYITVSDIGLEYQHFIPVFHYVSGNGNRTFVEIGLMQHNRTLALEWGGT